MSDIPRDSSTGGVTSRVEDGSLRRGVGWAWLIVMMGNVILYGLAILVSVAFPNLGAQSWYGGLFGTLFYLPLVVATIAAVASILRGRRRTGVGIFIGLATMAAVGLLLMAACFGLSAALSPHH